MSCDLCGGQIKGRTGLCMRCNRKIRRTIRKLRAIELKGGVCKTCGWSGHPSGFIFHHLDGQSKESEISTMFEKARWNEIIAEIEKCDLLCGRCHTILHSNDDILQVLIQGSRRRLWQGIGKVYLGWLSEDDVAQLVPQQADADLPSRTSVCGKCNGEFIHNYHGRRTLCNPCREKSKLKAEAICEGCGIKFEYIKGHARRGRFHNQDCYREWLRNRSHTTAPKEGVNGSPEDTISPGPISSP